MTGTGETQPSEEEDTDLDFEDYCVNHLPAMAVWAAPQLAKMDITAVAKAIQDGTAISIADGSFKNEHGTASWIIVGEDDSGQVCDQCVTPGYPSDQSAYRSELAGIYGAMVAVKMICGFHQIEQGTITLACDNQGALNKAKFPHRACSPDQAHFDLIGGIWKLRSEVKIDWKFHWVAGHQDDHVEYEDLDRWGQLNVQMDTLAKQHWKDTYMQEHRQLRIYGEPWSLWIEGEKVSRRTRQ